MHATPLSSADIGCFRLSINRVCLQPARFIGHCLTMRSANHRARDASVASVLLIGVVPDTKQWPPLMSLLGVHTLPVVNTVTCLLKSTVWSRAVRIWTTKIRFDPAADSIQIRSIRIGFDPNSVLKLVLTLIILLTANHCKTTVSAASRKLCQMSGMKLIIVHEPLFLLWMA